MTKRGYENSGTLTSKSQLNEQYLKGQKMKVQKHHDHGLYFSNSNCISGGSETHETLPLMQLFEPRTAFVDSSIYGRCDGQGATNDCANAGQEAGKSL